MLVDVDDFGLWRSCLLSERIVLRRVGRRYLRLDRRVAGYARLSPSILREFLTYTVLGIASDVSAVEAKAAQLANRIQEITAAKLRLAERLASDVCDKVEALGRGLCHRVCLLLAGDVVYGMAHDCPRPERSTGAMVRGSDIDIVVLVEDDLPGDVVEQIDQLIYQWKYRLLINPSDREELDYVLKPLSRVREQSAFVDFRDMVACKILHEAIRLGGSERLHEEARAILSEKGIPVLLRKMEDDAAAFREAAEKHLLALGEEALTGDDVYLFYTSEETEEFE